MDLQCVDYQPSRGSAFLWSIVMIFPFLLDGRLSRLGWAVNMKKGKMTIVGTSFLFFVWLACAVFYSQAFIEILPCGMLSFRFLCGKVYG